MPQGDTKKIVSPIILLLSSLFLFSSQFQCKRKVTQHTVETRELNNINTFGMHMISTYLKKK